MYQDSTVVAMLSGGTVPLPRVAASVLSEASVSECKPI